MSHVLTVTVLRFPSNVIKKKAIANHFWFCDCKMEVDCNLFFLYVWKLY